MQRLRSFKAIAAPAFVAGAIGFAAAGMTAGAPLAGAAGTPVAGPADPRIVTADASPDGIGFASAHAAAVREPSRADAWGGARPGMESTLADRVVSYEIAATLDPTRHTIAGDEQLTWRNRSGQTVRAVYLHLYLNAFEGSQSTYAIESRIPGFNSRSDIPSRDGEWGHIELTRVVQGDAVVPWEFVHPDGGPDADHTVVRLDLPRAVAPGSSTALDIAFLDQLPRIKARTGYFGSFHLVGQWFPKIGVLELPGERGATQPQWNVHEFHLNSEFYADYGWFDVRLTIPDGYIVGATGEELGPPVEAHGMSTHRFVQGDVHDFAWTADNRTARPLQGEYRGAHSPVVKVKVLYPPEYAAAAAGVQKAAIDSLAYFSRTLGPYPYGTLTAVIPPFNAEEAGGMEYPTFFTVTPYANPEPGTSQGSLEDFETIHEFGHGYFYGILGSNEFEEPMLDEGLNTYWDLRMLSERKQQIALGSHFSKLLGLTVHLPAFDFAQLAAMRSDPADGLGANSWDRLSSASYASIYARTATAMHDLEAAVGKEAMERAVQEYYRRWKFRHPSVADFREVLAQVTGRRDLVDTVFEQQVYGAQKLDDGIESLTSIEETPEPGTSQIGGKWIEVTQAQADQQAKEIRAAWQKGHPNAKPGTGPFPYRTTLLLRRRGAAVRQEVLVRFADGSSTRAIWDDAEPWRRYVWVKPVQAVSAEIDPGGKNLLDANILDNSRTLKAGRIASLEWAGVFASLIESLLSLLAAV
jgi:hypothetical protein